MKKNVKKPVQFKKVGFKKKIKSEFGILSVSDAATCKLLEQLLKKSGADYAAKTGVMIPVTIRAELVDVWGSFDGIDQEFILNIKSVEVAK